MKKYKLLVNDTIKVEDRTLYRIKALIDFSDIKAGDLGGYIEKEDNLSHEGNCWVYNKAIVSGKAWVCGNARVYGNAIVYGDARVYGNAEVYGNAKVFGNAIVFGDAKVFGNAKVFGDARVNAEVYGDARVYGNAIVIGARVYGNTKVFGNAIVIGARVYGNAEVYGNARVYGNASLCSNAYISSNDDIALVQYFGSENRTTTFYRTKDGSIGVKCGCFEGTLDEFKSKVKETHGDSCYAKEYLMIADLMEMRFNREKENMKKK